MIIEAASGIWRVQMSLKKVDHESESTRTRHRCTASLLKIIDAYKVRSLARVSIQEYLGGLDEVIPLLDRLALIFHVIDKYRAVSILLLRAIDDFQVSTLCALCQAQGELVELMRDVLEIELLIREFRYDPQSLEHWLKADPDVRKNSFSANALRQRHANRLGIKPQDLPDASDYRLHSQALHISPLAEASPFKLRGMNISDDPFGVDLGLFRNPSPRRVPCENSC